MPRSCCSMRPFSSNASVYVSKSNDPYFNLSFEDWLFRRKDGPEHVLYLYRNDPCVVIGRNQNPWKEINLQRLSQLGIPFVRRRSGGGTVYHDLGNTNYCVFTPRTTFDRKTNATMMSHALRQLGIPAYVNERHDICVEQFKMSRTSAVQGSAFKLTSNRAYHHGTMLIDADLGALRGLLKNNKNIIGKSVASVSSPVQNLEHWSANIDHDSFVEAATERFARQYESSSDVEYLDEEALAAEPSLAKGKRELESWQWAYGQTPEFVHKIEDVFEGQDITLSITSKHGLVTAVDVHQGPEELQRQAEALVGQFYGGSTSGCPEGQGKSSDQTSEASAPFTAWLRGQMA